MDTLTAVQRLAVALLVGLLIGLDRERTELRGVRNLFAGVRTFPLIALTGALPMLFPSPERMVLLAIAFLSVAAITVIAYFRSAADVDAGSTTEVAAIGTFVLGAVAGSGELLIASATGVAVATLLVAKPGLKGFSRALTPAEVTAITEMAVISLIILPLMPRRGFGPWEVWNPFEIWLVVVLVSALSLAGFVAMRLVGEHRGLALTGFVGGLVSSTAITLSMAERSRAKGAPAGALAAAVVLASTVMSGRVAVICAVIDAHVVLRIAPVLVAMSVVGLVAARILARAAEKDSAPGKRKVSNPFSLRRAILFAAIYAVVRFAVRAAQETIGSAGMFVTAFLASLADVDAPTIAFLRGGPMEGSWRDPATGIAIAVVANTLSKLGLAWGLGAGPFRRHVAVTLGAMALVGGVATAIAHRMG